MQPTHNDANLTRSLKYTAIVTGLMAIFNVVFSQWVLVVFFAIIAVGTGAVSWQRARSEQRAITESGSAGPQE